MKTKTFFSKFVLFLFLSLITFSLSFLSPNNNQNSIVDNDPPIIYKVTGKFTVTGKIQIYETSCDPEKGELTFIIPGKSSNFLSDYTFSLGFNYPKKSSALCTIYAEKSSNYGIYCVIDTTKTIIKETKLQLLSEYSFEFEMENWKEMIGPYYVLKELISCEPEYKHEFVYYTSFIDRGCGMLGNNRTLANYGYYLNYTQEQKMKYFHFQMDIMADDKVIKNAECHVDTTDYETEMFGPKKVLNILLCTFHDFGYIYYKSQYPVIRETGYRIKIHDNSKDKEFFSNCKGEYIRNNKNIWLILTGIVLLLL